MPSPMPEFAMPPQATAPEGPESPERASGASVAAPAAAVRSQRSQVGPAAPAPRAAGRRRLVAGAILLALAGAGGGTAAIVQAVDRQAAAAAADALTTVALDYLGAISEGRAETANALVPVEGPAPLLTDAALAAATRIQEFGVEAVELDGDTAVVVVDFRTGQRRVERRLDAVREGGAWRLTTTVAERVVLDSAGLGALPRQLGAELGTGLDTGLDDEAGSGEGALLYPGVYRTEPFEHGIASVDAVTVVVDGDSGTAQVSGASRWSLPPGVGDEARARALSHAVACQSSGSCALPSPALLGLGDQATARLGEEGAVEFEVPVRVLQDGTSGPTQLEVGVRALASAAGGIDWECSPPVVRTSPAPAERAWEACD